MDKHQKPSRAGLNGKPMITNKPLQIQYGHNGDLIVIAFSQHIDNLMMSEIQINEMIDAMQLAKTKLAQHKSVSAQLGGHGHA